MKRLLWPLYNHLIKAYPLFSGCGACPERPIPFQERRENLEHAFPVDLVYTWVNGNDPVWLEKRNSHLGEARQYSSLSQGSALFSDNDELLYSLRSVEQYVPWARKIFIITDRQIPHWLNCNHEKIAIIDHTEIIPKEYLPTFNSHVIEAYLHNIPDLSEHFIYCNDDFFFTAPSQPGDFYTSNGLPYIFMDWRANRHTGYSRRDTPHACSYANTLAYMAAKGKTPDSDIIIAHIPYPQRKSNAKDGFVFFEEGIRAFSHNRFRKFNEMAFYCHALPFLSYMRKKSIPVDIPFYYINTNRFDRNTYYISMVKEQNQGVLPLAICLNTVGERHPRHPRHTDMKNFLRTFYPRPSGFEL